MDAHELCRDADDVDGPGRIASDALARLLICHWHLRAEKRVERIDAAAGAASCNNLDLDNGIVKIVAET